MYVHNNNMYVYNMYMHIHACPLIRYLLIYLQLFCIVIAAYTTEISIYTFQSTNSAYAAHLICYDNPKAETSGFRVCLSLMGVAISSILVCLVLMILDVFIPCVNTKVMII